MATVTATKKQADWFRVDRAGLAQQLERRDKAFAAFELYQNAVDTGAKNITMTLEQITQRTARLVVEDDDPDGFKDLTHAYTLFAPSEKKTDPTKRGRFNVGEKLVLAICDTASIISTKGSVLFDDKGRHEVGAKRERGSMFDAVVRMSASDVALVAKRINELVVPAGVVFTFNGREIARRKPVLTFQATLPSEIANAEGNMVRTFRKTSVALYEPRDGEKAQIYEMGIPVVEHENRWHVDIGQKVPLNIDRDNVTPAFLRDLRTAVLDAAVALIDKDDAASVWVKDALPRASNEAVAKVITERYGDKAVAYDMSDTEANKVAHSQGYTVVHGGSLGKEEWGRVRELGLLKPAGQVTPSNSTLELSEDGKPPLERSKWTPGMERMETYAKAIARSLLSGLDVEVLITNDPNGGYDAAFGRTTRTLRLNVGALGHKWFNEPSEEQVLALLIHEYAHYISGDHLSHAYHEAGFTLGARAVTLARRGMLPEIPMGGR